MARMMRLPVIFALSLLLVDCPSAPKPPETTVAAPTFSPAEGSYTAAQTVTITTSTEGAQIRYTTDSSVPSVEPLSTTTMWASGGASGDARTLRRHSSSRSRPLKLTQPRKESCIRFIVICCSIPVIQTIGEAGSRRHNLPLCAVRPFLRKPQWNYDGLSIHRALGKRKRLS